MLFFKNWSYCYKIGGTRQTINKFAHNISVEENLYSLYFIQFSRHLFIGIHEKEMKIQALNHEQNKRYGMINAGELHGERKSRDVYYMINGGKCRDIHIYQYL